LLSSMPSSALVQPVASALYNIIIAWTVCFCNLIYIIFTWITCLFNFVCSIVTTWRTHFFIFIYGTLFKKGTADQVLEILKADPVSETLCFFIGI
jgi:hypothetical protein